MPDGRDATKSPEFSIVIPTRDRPAELQRCLKAVAQLENPKDEFEVIVVDDGSRQSYDQVITSFSGILQLSYLRCGGNGPAQARNAGVEVGRGNFVALTDDDCAPAPDWLTSLGQALRNRPNALAGGRTINALPENPCAEASQVLISYLYDYYNTGKHDTRFFASSNLGMSRSLYLECGGFDPRFPLAGGEDRDFCDRWIASGKPMIYVKDGVVNHSHDLTLLGFLRQHFTYGRGAWHFHKARLGRGRGKVRVEPLPFLTGMLARPFHEPSLRSPLAVSCLIGTSVVVNALGYFHERFHSK